MNWLRLLSAFQALQMPPGFFGVTHEQARDIIQEMTGKRPEGTPPRPTQLSAMDHYLQWHLGGSDEEQD